MDTVVPYSITGHDSEQDKLTASPKAKQLVAMSMQVSLRLSPPCTGLSVQGLFMQRNSTVQTRGRVTLPLTVRQALLVAPGDDVVFIETAPGRFELRARARRAALLERTGASTTEGPGRRNAVQTALT